MNRRKRKNSKTGLILIIIGIVAIAVIAAIMIINFKKGKTGGDIQSQLDEQRSQIDFETDVIAYGDDESDSYDFTGDYFDTSTRKGTMTITKADAGYNINITYAETDDVVTIWKMTSVYDPYRKALSFRDCTRTDYTMFSTEGESGGTDVYTDGSGFIYLASGSLYWVDDKEDMGAGLMFTSADEESIKNAIGASDDGSSSGGSTSGEGTSGEGASDENVSGENAEAETTDTTETTETTESTETKEAAE